MAMEKKGKTQQELIKIAYKVYNLIADELKDENDMGDPVEATIVLAIAHRMVFATVERDDGIDKAREATSAIIDLVNCTMKDGAWDKENQRMF